MLREGGLDSGSVAYSKPSGEGKIHNLSRGMYNISQFGQYRTFYWSNLSFMLKYV